MAHKLLSYLYAQVINKYSSLLTRISPELCIKYRFKKSFGRKIDLNNPQTLDEKIQWLKLNYYIGNPLVRDCADKYAVRKYVEDCGCAEILNPLYGVYDNIEEVPWDDLPNQFVLKWNFGCGDNFICFNKSDHNFEDIKRLFKKWRKKYNTFYLPYAELQYKGIVPKIVCEKLIETETGTLPVDYKLYCFNGKPLCALVCVGREKGHPDFYFFDKGWNLKRYNKKGLAVPKDFTLPKPESYELLFEYAEKLSKPFPFVRADFYLEKGKVIFGELTFTPSGGFDSGRLPQTQKLFGDMVNLDSVK